MREEGRWKKMCLGSDQLTWRRTDAFHVKSAARAASWHSLRHRGPRPAPCFLFPFHISSYPSREGARPTGWDGMGPKADAMEPLSLNGLQLSSLICLSISRGCLKRTSMESPDKLLRRVKNQHVLQGFSRPEGPVRGARMSMTISESR
ncbi:hypothetical protein LY76DRAFT_36869 [Colletotrichum caudatum]|nr:hypothetical protein LY76DRAFT_36869 [Colletotrichum caudatum]